MNHPNLDTPFPKYDFKRADLGDMFASKVSYHLGSYSNGGRIGISGTAWYKKPGSARWQNFTHVCTIYPSAGSLISDSVDLLRMRLVVLEELLSERVMIQNRDGRNAMFVRLALSTKGWSE